MTNIFRSIVNWSQNHYNLTITIIKKALLNIKVELPHKRNIMGHNNTIRIPTHFISPLESDFLKGKS